MTFVETLLLLGTGVFIGGLGMRVLWLMSIEEERGCEDGE